MAVSLLLMHQTNCLTEIFPVGFNLLFAAGTIAEYNQNRCTGVVVRSETAQDQ
jgi:hypothetical protein